MNPHGIKIGLGKGNTPQMSEKEITQTIMFINTLGYYQCYGAVKKWFKWDDKTTNTNLKFVFDKVIKKENI
tara:strand:+ start:417 stop:629 length:213 start_codon:yes stop_codon:yes gene_type:complete